MFGCAVPGSSLLAIGLGTAFVASGCSRQPEPIRAMVFAAASLTASFEDLAAAFAKTQPGHEIDLHCAGTPRLVLQLREGAPADVFASADDTQMQRVVDAGQVATPPITFASNRLAIVTAQGNPKGIRELADLARPELRVVLCAPHVPAGNYARSALLRAGVEVRSASDEPSVRAVVSKVQLGQVDAGIVYATDASRAAGHLDIVAIPQQHNITGSYPIAVLSTGRQRACADAFVAFVLSDEGQRILASHGFAAP